MSPQLSLRESMQRDEDARDCCSSCSKTVSYSNSQLTKAVDATFSYRQDQGLGSPDELVRTSNPLGGEAQRMHLRKRKCNFNDCHSPAQITADFLSGIFQDLAEVKNDEIVEGDCSVTYPLVSNPLQGTPDTLTESEPNSNFRPSKKSRISHSLSRCPRSFIKLQQISAHMTDHQITNEEDSPSLLNQETDHLSNYVHPISSDSTAAEMVDHIFSDSVTNINFPILPSCNLPATVSESSCTSNNITQTAVQAAQVLENHNTNHVEGRVHDFTHNKDGYGWFVEMDEGNVRDRLQAVAAASESCRAIATPENSALTFSASCPLKAVSLDSEVEWAKAADTVDDVLGGILF